MKPQACQIYCLETMFEGKPEVIPQPLGRHLRLALASRLNSRVKRAFRTHLNRLMGWVSNFTGGNAKSSSPTIDSVATDLKAGDLVQVRPREEIQATLDPWGRLKGCGFMPEMWQYCGTTQRVLKPMERFLDECEYQIKRCRGVVLLEGLMCQGVVESGRCDRSCFFFWRKEWLVKID